MKVIKALSSIVSSAMLQSHNDSKTHRILFIVGLSWFFALCSHARIWLPFNAVPISLMPLPLLFFAECVGRPAISAYFLFLIQGAFGLPFFPHIGFQGTDLFGPLTGYRIGFCLAMTFMVATHIENFNDKIFIFIRYWFANIIIFFFGLCHLAFYTHAQNLLFLGLYPFLFGDFIIKPILLLIALSKITVVQNKNNEQQKTW